MKGAKTAILILLVGWIATVVLITNFVVNPASQVVQAMTDEEYEPVDCAPYFTAGQAIIYKCPDYDDNIVCYSQLNGLMFCVYQN